MLEGRGLITLLILTLILWAGSASAKLYKWTDPTGRHFYSDVPPPGGKAGIMEIKVNTERISQTEPAKVSAETKTAQHDVKAKKVVIYTTTWCGFCRKARAYFDAKGIRYTDYDIENSRKGRMDYKRLKGAGVPIIIIGKERMDGFNQSKFEKLYES